MENFDTILQNIESAAAVVQSSSNLANCDRKSAESFFLELRTWKAPFKFCHFVLEKENVSEYAKFQVLCVLKDAVIREWQSLDSEEIETIWKYLLQLVMIKNKKHAAYVSNEILQIIAMIVKRGTFDGKSGETDKIYETVTNIIATNDPEMVSLACQMLLNICTEYGATWASSVGLTWDFHVRAKRHFELTDLKKIFELTLRVLYGFAGRLGSLEVTERRTVKLLERFLNVSVCILQWNFGSRHLPRRLTYSLEFSSAHNLHPPDTWRDLLLNDDVVKFFFMLHSHLRSVDLSLINPSVQCITQLASLCGSIFANDKARTKYLSLFITGLMELFSTGVLEYEAVSFAETVQKLFHYNPLSNFRKLDSQLLSTFFHFVTQTTLEFCRKAAFEAFGDGGDTLYQEAYGKLLDGWTVQLKAESRLEENDNGCKMLGDHANQVFDCFVKCHMSKPIGARPPLTEHVTKTAYHFDDDNEDDKERFLDVLLNIGIFGRHSVERSVGLLTNLSTQTISDYKTLVEKSVGEQSKDNAFVERLQNLQEDIHWLLLITGNFLTSCDDCGADRIFYTPVNLHNLSCKSSGDLSASQDFLLSSLSDVQNFPVQSQSVDVIVGLISCVLRWSTLENYLLLNQAFHFLSPQVGETTLWCLKRILKAYCESDGRYATPSAPCTLKETFRAGTMTSSLLTRYVLDKFFLVLSQWSSESDVNKEAAAFLIQFIDTDHKAEDIAKSGYVLDKIKSVHLEKLCPSARKDLLKCIVKICFASEQAETKQAFQNLVLNPLSTRYDAYVDRLTNHKVCPERPVILSGLIDMLDCFSGLVQGISKWAGGREIFHVIFAVMQSSVNLMSTVKNEQTLTDAILQLFVDVTSKLTSCIGNHNEAEAFYQCVLNMLQCYASNNAGKYAALSVVEDELISDFLLFLKMLVNLLSKEIYLALGAASDVLFIDSKASSAPPLNIVSLVVAGLQTVLPLMNEEFLRYPPICSTYYKLLTSLCQLYTASVLRLSPDIRRPLLNSVKIALSFEYGTELVKMSLELVHALATYSVQYLFLREVQLVVPELQDFIEPVFLTCLKAACEIDVLHDASTCLFSLICLHEITFHAYIAELIAKHDDALSRQTLSQAFDKLLPSSLRAAVQKQAVYRKEKLSFRDRFETFLDDIQGVLKIQ